MAEIINNFGKVTGWSDHEVVIYGRKLVGISKISYKDEEERESVFGAGKYPIGIGGGNKTAECSMTLLAEEVAGLLRSLPEGMSLSDIPPTDISVLTMHGNTLVKDVIHNFSFTGLGKEVSQNDKAVWLEMPCHCTHITWGRRA